MMVKLQCEDAVFDRSEHKSSLPDRAAREHRKSSAFVPPRIVCRGTNRDQSLEFSKRFLAMSSVRKNVLFVLGFLSAAGIIGQLVMGQLILEGNVKLAKAHQHSGYTTVLIVLVYVIMSLMAIAATPTRNDK
jgi:hypothetical protein